MPMPFSGQTEPMVCIYGIQNAATVKDWLHGLRQERLEISMPSQADEHELSCLEFAVEGASQLCSISSTDCGFVLRANAECYKQGPKIKEGRPALRNQWPAVCQRSCNSGGSRGRLVDFSLQARAPTRSSMRSSPILQPGWSMNCLRNALAQWRRPMTNRCSSSCTACRARARARSSLGSGSSSSAAGGGGRFQRFAAWLRRSTRRQVLLGVDVAFNGSAARDLSLVACA